jgi:hypothetical protein
VSLRAKPVSLAVCMREGEKREALLQKISGRIRLTADIWVFAEVVIF